MKRAPIFVFIAIILCLATIVLPILLRMSGNQRYDWGSYSYEHVHICDGATGVCATVEGWYEDEIGVELKTKEFGSIYCSEGTYILIEGSDKCPFCK